MSDNNSESVNLVPHYEKMPPSEKNKKRGVIVIIQNIKRSLAIFEPRGGGASLVIDFVLIRKVKVVKE